MAAALHDLQVFALVFVLFTRVSFIYWQKPYTPPTSSSPSTGQPVTAKAQQQPKSNDIWQQNQDLFGGLTTQAVCAQLSCERASSSYIRFPAYTFARAPDVALASTQENVGRAGGISAIFYRRVARCVVADLTLNKQYICDVQWQWVHVAYARSSGGA